MPSEQHNLETIRIRRDFLAAAKAQKYVTRALVLQARKQDTSTMRFGLTASKKTGNAVTRNRIRRRLRALARDILPRHGKQGFDYVLIGRFITPTMPYKTLKKDLKRALRHIHKTII